MTLDLSSDDEIFSVRLHFDVLPDGAALPRAARQSNAHEKPKPGNAGEPLRFEIRVACQALPVEIKNLAALLG